MSKENKKFVIIAEQYLEYINKNDFVNMRKMEKLFDIKLNTDFAILKRFDIRDQAVYYDYNVEKHKYIITEIQKIKGIHRKYKKQINRKIKCFLDKIQEEQR